MCFVSAILVSGTWMPSVFSVVSVSRTLEVTGDRDTSQISRSLVCPSPCCGGHSSVSVFLPATITSVTTSNNPGFMSLLTASRAQEDNLPSSRAIGTCRPAGRRRRRGSRGTGDCVENLVGVLHMAGDDLETPQAHQSSVCTELTAVLTSLLRVRVLAGEVDRSLGLLGLGALFSLEMFGVRGENGI